jgi:hypothetical protein
MRNTHRATESGVEASSIERTGNLQSTRLSPRVSRILEGMERMGDPALSPYERFAYCHYAGSISLPSTSSCPRAPSRRTTSIPWSSPMSWSPRHGQADEGGRHGRPRPRDRDTSAFDFLERPAREVRFLREPRSPRVLDRRPERKVALPLRIGSVGTIRRGRAARGGTRHRPHRLHGAGGIGDRPRGALRRPGVV